ncbi:MAG: hypothetical protein M0Z79_10155 [Nitrospiraceae bacterium]|nr:hypothetical protein [Nitrospiraceae bacterium]
MSCPLLMEWVISSCRGNVKPYVPSLLELREYCNAKQYDRCPVFKGFYVGEEGNARGAHSPQCAGVGVGELTS